jgi:hypothetical protein
MRNPHPIDLALAASLVALQALLTIAVALVALGLTLAHCRPSKAPVAAPAPIAPPAPRRPAAGPLTALPVRELRLLARAAGHRQLARSGRKADLLAALA